MIEVLAETVAILLDDLHDKYKRHPEDLSSELLVKATTIFAERVSITRSRDKVRVDIKGPHSIERIELVVSHVQSVDTQIAHLLKNRKGYR